MPFSSRNFNKGDYVKVERTPLTGEITYVGESSLVLTRVDGKRKALSYTDIDDFYQAERPATAPEHWPPQMGDVWKQTKVVPSVASYPSWYWHVAYRTEGPGSMAFFNGTSKLKEIPWDFRDAERGYTWELAFRRKGIG